VKATTFRSEAFAHGARMLRTALGAAIASYLEDPGIVEVMLNPDGRLWIDRLSGGLEDTGCRVAPADAERLVARHVGVEVHAGSPRVSAELPESGERFEGLAPPVVAAPCFAIRRPAVAVFTLGDYIEAGIMSGAQAELLRASVQERKNILVAGGTSTGKTTLVNAQLAEVAKTGDRVVLIEDSRAARPARAAPKRPGRIPQRGDNDAVAPHAEWRPVRFRRTFPSGQQLHRGVKSMPLYTVTTQSGVLGSEARAKFAGELTTLHSEYAGVPKNWVHIVFQDYAPGNGFTAGEVAATAALTLLIRTGRSADYKRGLLKRLWELFQAATGAPDDQIVIGIQEVPSSQAMEMGQIMPDVGV
jgi:phenylpyruvate tautomerase PptA (4-oxalocrotonate tautomerase family)